MARRTIWTPPTAAPASSCPASSCGPASPRSPGRAPSLRSSAALCPLHRRRFLALGAGALALPGLARAGSRSSAFAEDFVFAPLDGVGDPLRLADYEGRPVLVVNTASRCGFTPQYDALQALWERFRDRGLVVLGTPSRDYGRQEFEDEGEIKSFCEVNFAIDFPMTGLVRTKGPEAHPFYAWAAQEARLDGRDLPTPRWNFHKYLLSPDGTLAGAWDSAVPPGAPEIEAAILGLLPSQG